MELNQYQELAARTINKELTWKQQGRHALYGMASEVGEIQGIYQKKYQGHPFDESEVKKEVGDLMWFIAEYCTAHGWTLEEIAQANIDKLIARYPEGFDAERSVNRGKYEQSGEKKKNPQNIGQNT